MKLATHTSLTLGLALLATFAGAVNFLALNDIFHGGSDLALEWSLVRYANAVFLAFLLSAASLAWRYRRRLTATPAAA